MRVHYLVMFLVAGVQSTTLRAADPSDEQQLREYVMSRYDELLEQSCPIENNQVARLLAMPLEMVARGNIAAYPAECLLWMHAFADGQKNRVLCTVYEGYERDGERTESITVVVACPQEYTGVGEHDAPDAESLEILPLMMSDEVVWVRDVHQEGREVRATIVVRCPVKELASRQAGTIVLACTFLLERDAESGSFQWSPKAKTAKFVGRYGERIIEEDGKKSEKPACGVGNRGRANEADEHGKT